VLAQNYFSRQHSLILAHDIFTTLTPSCNSQWMSFGRCHRSLGKLYLDSRCYRTKSDGSIRTITALSVVVSALSYGGIISLYQFIFASHLVFTTKIVPQVWRVFTAFLITKPKFAILLDPYFLYQYGSAIERESSRFAQPGDFFVYTMFVGSVIVVSICLLAYTCIAHSVDLLATEASPRIICPPSLSQWLKWFLEPRKSTPAHRAVRHSQNIKGPLRCVGMVG
jgi:hypothetical protein